MTKQKLDAAFHDLMTTVCNKGKYDTNVAEMATVINYNQARHTADVQPLVDDKGGKDDVGMISECPVLYQCYAVDELRSEIISKAGEHLKSIDKKPMMKKGATVFIVFNNRDLDNFEGKKFTKSSDRMHDINDAVVVGVVE